MSEQIEEKKNVDTQDEIEEVGGFLGKLYGGLNMSWLFVVLFAVGTAILTSIFLIVPIFKDTSFYKMGVTMEAWIFFAIIIMANCKKPLESSLKVFVFFLISQPLIYLFQVPFSKMGWQIFMYYKYWFIWTVLTLPMAFIGWFIVKRNWFSVIILSPALFLLAGEMISALNNCFNHPPKLLITGIFCLVQIAFYLIRFTSTKILRDAALFIPVLACVIFFMKPEVEVDGLNFLPDNPVLSESAVLTVDSEDGATITLTETGADSMIRIQTEKYGETPFTIKDGDKEYHYVVNVFEDDRGINMVEIRVAK